MQVQRSILRPRLSRVLTVLALSLWIGSLPLTGVVLTAGHTAVSGGKILLLGWTTLLYGNFAWFANLSFLLAAGRLLLGKEAVVPATFAVMLAIDTLRLSESFNLIGGGSSEVFGFGWGLVLWWTSLCIALTAAGVSTFELCQAEAAPRIGAVWISVIGIMLCAGMLGAVSKIARHDHMLANADEKTRLSGLAFKRAPVCSAIVPPVALPLMRDVGPVEMKFSERLYGSPAAPFHSPRELLEWGISALRIEDRDYSLVAAGEAKMLTSVSALNPVAATLHIVTTDFGGLQGVSVKLQAQPSGRTVFEQSWKQEESRLRSCPEYAGSPEKGQQPRKLLTEALTIEASAPLLLPYERDLVLANRADATVVLRGGIDHAKVWPPFSPPPTSFNTQPTASESAYRRTGNRKCPNGVGWATRDQFSNPKGLHLGWPFLVGDRAFFPELRGAAENRNATCAGDHVYLYSGFPRAGKYYLLIEKRMLSDFRRTWTGAILIADGIEAVGPNGLRVDSVQENADGVTINVTEDQTGRSATVRAPLKTTNRSN